MRDVVFKPLYMLSACNEPGSMTNCVTAAVCLPSGVGHGDPFLALLTKGPFWRLALHGRRP